MIYTLCLVGAVICAIVTFIVVPTFIAMDLPHPGYTSPTVARIALLLIWARGIRKGRA